MRHVRPLLLSTFLAGVLATQVAPVFAQTCACPPVQGDLGAPPPSARPTSPSTPTRPRRPCRTMTSRRFRPTATCGRRDTGRGTAMNTSGCPAPGSSRRSPACCGLRAIGAFVGGVYAFHRGYWGEHVGFYGGVYYGFGYGGAGYEGGHWDNGRFFYNRAVTNIGRVDIVNVYNQPVTINETNNRVSFNGGPNGLDAKPTAAELEAAKEKHLAPTSDQLHNARVAGRTESGVRLRQQGQAAHRGDGEARRVQGRRGRPRQGRRRPAAADRRDAGRPGTKGRSTTPEPTKTPLEKKLEPPKPEATKPTPETKVERPKPEPTKPRPERSSSDPSRSRPRRRREEARAAEARADESRAGEEARAAEARTDEDQSAESRAARQAAGRQA